MITAPPTDFQCELRNLINKFSKENESNTPDFLLADFLCDCLNTYNKTINNREEWYGRLRRVEYYVVPANPYITNHS